MKRELYKNIALTVAVFLIALLISYFIGQTIGINILNFSNLRSLNILAFPLPVIITSVFILMKFKKAKVKLLLIFWFVLFALIVFLNLIGVKFYLLNQLDNDFCVQPTNSTTTNDYMNNNFCPQP